MVASHLRCGRYLAQPLLRLLLGGPETTGPQPAPVPPPGTVNGPAPDDTDLRQFIMGRLAVTGESSSNELALQYHDYLRRKGMQPVPEACRARVEEAARHLDQEGLLTAIPRHDGLQLRGK